MTTLAAKQVGASGIPTLINASLYNPWDQVPAAPNAMDDEFTGWSGWTVWDATSAALLTDDGDGTFDARTTPAALHYRRKTIGSYIMLQFPITGGPGAPHQVFIYKAITGLTTNMLFWAKWTVLGQSNSNGALAPTGARFGVFADLAGRPSPVTLDTVEIGRTASSNQLRYLNSAGVGAGTTSTGLDRNLPTITVMEQRAANDRVAWALDEYGSAQSIPGAGNGNYVSAYVGWYLNPQQLTNLGGPWITIDYFRRKDGATAWIV